MFEEYLVAADVPENCFKDIRVQFMMIIGRYTHTHGREQAQVTDTHTKPWRQGQISRSFEEGIIHHINAIIGFIICWEF